MCLKTLSASCCLFTLLFYASSGTGAVTGDSETITADGAAAVAIAHSQSVVQTLQSQVDTAALPAITLDPVASTTLQALSEQESIPKQIGIGRSIPELSTFASTGTTLGWYSLAAADHYTAVTITSPGSRALRIGMQASNLPQGAEIRFFGLHEGRVADVSLVSGATVRKTLSLNQSSDPDNPDAQIFWSPTVAGDSIGVEVYLPADVDPETVQVSFPRLSHISELPFVPQEGRIGVQGYGDADSCQNDAVCATAWGNAAKATAGMQFTTYEGTYICTGTLLNDLDPTTTIPFFISANHCIGSQSVASTLETVWFWQSSFCNGSSRSSLYSVLSSGAILLHTQGMSTSDPGSTSMDVSLLQLNGTPPAGAYFMGWTTSAPPGSGSSRTGVHHPKGDWKKISYGTSEGGAACGWYDGQYFGCVSGSGNFYHVLWTNGGTEGGSSGSGLYADSEHLIGTLTGGDGACSGSNSFYSSFRAAYSLGNYGQWLDNAPEPETPVLVVPSNFLLLK